MVLDISKVPPLTAIRAEVLAEEVAVFVIKLSEHLDISYTDAAHVASRVYQGKGNG